MSSVAWGINPEEYPVEGKVLYNAGLPGSTAEEQYHYVKLLLDQAPTIKKVYVDINHAAFLNPVSHGPDFSADRMGIRVPTIKDFAFTALSRYALVHSIKAWRVNRNRMMIRHILHDTGDGFHHYPEAPSFADYKRNMEWRLSAHPLRPIHSAEVFQDQVDYLKKIVNLCKSRGVQAELYFAPMHVWLLEQERYQGSFYVFTELRRRVADFHPFWDFGLCTEVVAEPIDQMRYFIDGIHYRPRTGTLVLGTINGKPPAGVSETFGVLVDKSNIDAHLARFSRGLEQWRLDNPKEAAQIRRHFERLFKRTLPAEVASALERKKPPVVEDSEPECPASGPPRGWAAPRPTPDLP
jgi:hypothetical protein